MIYIFHKTRSLTICKGGWIKSSIHNVDNEKHANKTATVKELSGRNAHSDHNMESTLYIFHIVESTI